jgi:adenylosuccinate synthase
MTDQVDLFWGAGYSAHEDWFVTEVDDQRFGDDGEAWGEAGSVTGRRHRVSTHKGLALAKLV